MRRYQITLERYGISKAAYEELHGFCTQYSEKKRKINDAISIKSPNIDGMPHSENTSDPTARAGESIEKSMEDIALIEKTANDVDAFLAPWIIKSVTEDIPAWRLISNYKMPTNEKIFSQKRRQFYFLLAKKKNII